MLDVCGSLEGILCVERTRPESSGSVSLLVALPFGPACDADDNGLTISLTGSSDAWGVVDRLLAPGAALEELRDFGLSGHTPGGTELDRGGIISGLQLLLAISEAIQAEIWINAVLRQAVDSATTLQGDSLGVLIGSPAVILLQCSLAPGVVFARLLGTGGAEVAASPLEAAR